MSKIPETKLKKWEIIESFDESLSKFMQVRRDVVKFPNGKVIDDYYITTMAKVVMVVAINKAGKFILVRQYKHGVGEIIIECAAGMVDETEDLEDAAVRELAEETGAEATKENLVYLGKSVPSPTKSTHVVYGYLVRDVEISKSQDLDANEEIEVMEVEPATVIEAIKSGEIWASDTVNFLLKTYIQYPELFSVIH